LTLCKFFDIIFLEAKLQTKIMRKRYYKHKYNQRIIQVCSVMNGIVRIKLEKIGSESIKFPYLSNYNLKEFFKFYKKFSAYGTPLWKTINDFK